MSACGRSVDGRGSKLLVVRGGVQSGGGLGRWRSEWTGVLDGAIDEDKMRAKTMGSKFDEQQVDERTS